MPLFNFSDYTATYFLNRTKNNIVTVEMKDEANGDI
jgi:hypothetical protein